MKKLTVLLGCFLFGCASSDQVKTLEQKVSRLEKDVELLKAGGSPVDAEKEKKALELYGEVQEAMKENDLAKAKVKLEEMEKDYGDTRIWKRAQKTKSEIDIVGGDAPTSYAGVEWLQGESDISSGTTLLVFWEVWCPHCKREIPNLEASHNKYKDKGLKLVGLTKISRDKTKDEVMEFLTDNKVTYPIGKEDGKLGEAFVVSGIPAAALIKDGKIVWRGHPGSLNDTMLEGFLN